MQKETVKSILGAALFSGAVCCPMVASAHDSGLQTLGAGITATDVFQTTCFDDGNGKPAYLQVQVQSLAPVLKPEPLISIQALTSTGKKAASATDLIGGDTGLSKAINVYGGPATYFIMVDKAKAGAKNYQFTYHCETAGNVHTGTGEPLVPLQNQ